MEVGELHLQRAEAALSPSFLFLPLSPDWSTVSYEAALAAKAFKAAHYPEKEGDALRLGAQAEDKLNRPFLAARILEQLGDLLLKHKRAARRTSNSKGSSSANATAYEEGMHFYREAVKRYKAADQPDFAVSLLCRIAEKREHELSKAAREEAEKAYEEAVEIRLAKEELPHASEVYKHYLCMLVKAGEYKKAIAVTLRRNKCLYKLKQHLGMHKAILTVVVLFLALQQPTMADRTLSGPEALQSNFLGSAEFTAGALAVDAYKAKDALALAEALESPVFRFLLPPVAALVTKMAGKARDLLKETESQNTGVGIPGEAVDAMISECL